ncbi:DNA gyrase subunit A [Candidatus Magnetomorum sp. HK-1]|nr:DNA gyrase subunit A [Candidatus Magnetomorum sp. HK-1]
MLVPENSPKVSIEAEMKKSYLDYAMSVIIGRALPDVRDGLKPVHRRILFAMSQLKNDWNKPYKKSARIVGETIGRYHPHGDSAIYDAIVRMAQDFSLRYPLVNGQGNFGSVDGDPPAAMRYTEIRMMRISHELLKDIEKETIDFVPTYDESTYEPSVLPSRVPNLLVNGSSGIAVGMATNIPPHNLVEIIDALTALIDSPNLTVSDLIQYIPGPDFPTGGIIYGVDGIVKAYTTGKGIIRIRAKVTIEKEKKKGGGETIAITELPYQVNKARLIEKISALMKAKQLEGIRYARDESDRRGMRIAIAVKKDHMPEVILNQLYKHTQLENTFGIIMLAIVNNRPELLPLKQALSLFIDHRKQIIVRRTRYDLRKAEERAHILEGLKVALSNLDDVVALIRSSRTPVEAKEGLINQFDLSEIQAQAILDMRLQRLTGLEQEKINAEYDQLLKDIAWYKEILGSERIVLGIIKDELTEIKEQYGDKRRSRITSETKQISLEDMIVEEDMVVTVSNAGYIKRTPLSVYHSQRRGGKGKTAMETKDKDFLAHVFVASTHHYFLFFTNMGQVYWCKVYDIPQSGRVSKGKAIVNLLDFAENEELATVLPVAEFTPGSFVIMATKNGLVKKTDIIAYSRPRTNGIRAISLVPGDELISARITDGTHNIFLASCLGKSIRFHESDIRPSGRTARGVKGIKLAPGDRIVGMEVLSYGETLFVVTENGFGKRTSINEYTLQARGGKGVITIKTSARNGLVVSILLVENDDDVILMTETGKIIRLQVENISKISRNTQGVKLMDLDFGERITAAVRLSEKEAKGSDTDDEDADRPIQNKLIE